MTEKCGRTRGTFPVHERGIIEEPLSSSCLVEVLVGSQLIRVVVCTQSIKNLLTALLVDIALDFGNLVLNCSHYDH